MSFRDIADDMYSIAKQAASEDEILKASFLAGLELYGRPRPDKTERYQEELQFSKKWGIDLNKYPLHNGSGLMWHPEIKTENLADSVRNLDPEGEGRKPRKGTYLKFVKPTPVNENGLGVRLIGGDRFDSYFFEGKEFHPESVPGTMSFDKSDAAWLDEHDKGWRDIKDPIGPLTKVNTFVFPTAALQNGSVIVNPNTTDEEVYGKEDWWLKHKKNDEKKRKRVPTASEWMDGGMCDTFHYVFFPSTGKGIDAADTYSLLDPRMRETDGHVYLAGSEGVIIVTLPSDADVIFAKLQKRYGKDLTKYMGD
jgi:hypothetical protein